MARISNKSNKAATDTTAPAKVARVSKAKASGQQAKGKGKASGQQAPAKGKGRKAAPASGQQARGGRRSQYAGMTIKNVAGTDSPCRGGAAIRFDTIVAHRKVDDAIGATYTDTDGTAKAINSADIAYLVKRGLIEVA